MNFWNKTKGVEVLNALNLLFALLVVVLSVYPYGFYQRMFVTYFVVTYILEFFVEKKWQTFHWKPSNWLYVNFLVFFCLPICWIPFEESSEFTMGILENKLPFLLFGIVGIIGLNKLHRFRLYAYVFAIWSVVITLSVYCSIGFRQLMATDDLTILFMFKRTELYTSHFIYDLFLNLGMISAGYLLLKSKRVSSIICWSISLLLIYVTLLISDGRSGMIAAAVNFALLVFYYLWRRSKWLSVSMICVFLLLGVFVLKGKAKMQKDYSEDPRTVVWRHTIELIKEKPLTGYGANDAETVFLDRVSHAQDIMDTKDETLLRGIEQRRFQNAHPLSQILQSELEFGLIGLANILLIIFLPVFFVRDSLNRLLAMQLTVAVFIQLATDIFITTIPLFAYSLFVIILLAHERKCE